MKKHIQILIGFVMLAVSFIGCSTYSLETARMRDRDYNISKITLTENGLSQGEINSISQTKFPKEFPVDLSFIVMKDSYIDNSMEQLFLKNIVDSLKTSDKIGRIVPLPKFLIPREVNFPKMQELGIRSLTEYVVLFYIDTDTFFSVEELVNSKIEITSTIDFMVMDSKTTAIVAADRLFSNITYNAQVFKNSNKRKAQEELFSAQGKAFSKIVAGLFNIK